MFRFQPLVLAPLFLGAFPAIGHASPPKGQLPPISPVPIGQRAIRGFPSATPTGEFFVFRTIENQIDCETLGSPDLVGNYVSKEATIEMDANVNVQVSYINGGDLKNGQSTIPTAFQYSVRGVAMFDGMNATPSGPDVYTPFGALPNRTANQSGTIAFPSSMPYTTKGFKVRVLAERHGLNDPAGTYKTQIVLSWARL